MQRLGVYHSVPTTLLGLRYLGLRLQTRPMSRALRVEVDAARARLKEADEVWHAAVEERMALSGEVAYLDGEVDEVVAQLAAQVRLDARSRAGATGESGAYQLLFSKRPSDLTQSVAGDDQTTAVRAILGQIRALPDLAAYQPYAQRLEEAQGQLEAAVELREEHYAAEYQALAKRRLARDAAQRVYNQRYPQLQLLFPDDPRLVESFFLDFTSAAVKAAASEEPAAPGEEA